MSPSTSKPPLFAPPNHAVRQQHAERLCRPYREDVSSHDDNVSEDCCCWEPFGDGSSSPFSTSTAMEEKIEMTTTESTQETTSTSKKIASPVAADVAQEPVKNSTATNTTAPSSTSEPSFTFWMDWAEEEHGDDGVYNRHLEQMIAIQEEEDEETPTESNGPVPEEGCSGEALRAEPAVDMSGCPLQLVGEDIEEDDEYVKDEGADLKVETGATLEQLKVEGMDGADESEIQPESLDMVLSAKSEEALFKAMSESSKASQFLEAKDYEDALATFHTAVSFYGDILDESTTAVVNSASCYRNMSTITVKLQRFEAAIEFSRHAVTLYHRARVSLSQCMDAATAVEPKTTLDGKLLDTSVVPSERSCINDDVLCLDMIIIQTLQQQANLHLKYMNDLESAIACHEVVARHLVEVATNKQFGALSPVQVEDISYTVMTEVEHTALLKGTLEALGSYYTESHETNKEFSMTVYEDALDVLQTRFEDSPGDDALGNSVSLILRYLSEIYFLRRDIDRSVDALHDAMVVKLTVSGEPDAEALKILDKMGAANEKVGNWEKARSCYEQTMVARCEYYGRTHLCVAQSLAKMGHVVEKQQKGATTESMDLFKAANAIYALHMKALASPAISREVNDIIDHVPEASRRPERKEPIDKLNDSVERIPLSQEADRDRAQIYFDLGRSYMAMGNFKLATTCLIAAIKEVDQEDDCALHGLLQSMEFASNHESEPASETIDQLNTSIHTLGTVLSSSTTTDRPSSVPAPQLFAKMSEVDRSVLGVDEEGESKDCSWANFSFQTEARSWKKTEEEEEKAPELEDETKIAEKNPNYGLLYESFMADPTPKVKNVTVKRFVEAVKPKKIFKSERTPLKGNHLLGHLVTSCWPTKEQMQSRSASVADKTQRVASKGKKAVGSFLRHSSKILARKNAQENETLLSPQSSSSETVGICSFDNNSPLADCVSPTSHQWRDSDADLSKQRSRRQFV